MIFVLIEHCAESIADTANIMIFKAMVFNYYSDRLEGGGRREKGWRWKRG